MRIRHVASCPEDDPVHCATEDIPDYVHDQSIAWARANLGLTASLGNGWQLGAGVPFDVRLLSIRYEDMAGNPFEPPYPNIHHRNETLTGLSDGTLELRRFFRTEGGLSFGGAIGAVVPLGRTEEDPYALTAQGLAHQHQQLGSGVFQPSLAAQVYGGGETWGGYGRADARFGLYANSKGYQPPTVVSVTGGPVLRLSMKTQLMASGQITAETAERWHGEAHGGMISARVGGGVLYQPTPGLTLQLDARTTAFQASVASHGDEALRQRLIVGLGASWLPKRADAEE